VHFLTEESQREVYAQIAARAVAPGGVAIIGGFGPEGPTHCSGLPTWRVSARTRADLFAAAFSMIGELSHTHVTPSGAEQAFTWTILRRDSTGS
jgi:predicted deacetylase